MYRSRAGHLFFPCCFWAERTKKTALSALHQKRMKTTLTLALLAEAVDGKRLPRRTVSVCVCVFICVWKISNRIHQRKPTGNRRSEGESRRHKTVQQIIKIPSMKKLLGNWYEEVTYASSATDEITCNLELCVCLYFLLRPLLQ